MPYTIVVADTNTFTLSNGSSSFLATTVSSFAYFLSGSQMSLILIVDSATLSNDGTLEIRVILPENKTVATMNVENIIKVSNGDIETVGLARAVVGNTYISLYKKLDKLSNWVPGSITFSLNMSFDTV